MEATRLIKEALPYVKIVILSVSDDVQDFFEAIKKGAQGYLLKNMEPEYWLDYLISIVQGEAPISRIIATKILQEFSVQKVDMTDNKLSERENDVLQLVSQGLGNKTSEKSFTSVKVLLKTICATFWLNFICKTVCNSFLLLIRTVLLARDFSYIP